MEENTEMQMIPYTIHESDMARMERQLKRLWIVLIMTILLLVATNAGWIVYESQFEDVVTETYTSEADNGIALVNRDGVINYGESDVYPDEAPSP